MALRINVRDMKFVLYEQLGTERLLSLPCYAEVKREDIDMILDAAEKLAVGKIAPINKLCDHVGAQFKDGKVTYPEEIKDAYREFSAGMWNGVTMSPEYGGLGLPIVLNLCTNEMFMGASVGFDLTAQLTSAAAGVIHDFYVGPHKTTILEKMTSGEWTGTMCLTEPSAGSDVGALKTTAKKIAGSDAYLITGPKIFISAGEHDLTDNIIHLVLARVEGSPQGPKGISLFVVPKYAINADGTPGAWNDAACVRIEEKMGIHGSATSQLDFGSAGTCAGWIVGEVNEGLRYMFKMMNEERLNVGLQGLACGQAAYFEALDYAKERLQFTSLKAYKDPAAPKSPIIEHPDVRRMLMWMKAMTDGMRALLLTVGYAEDLAKGLADGDEKAKVQDFVELMTPVCKAYCSDVGFKVCELGVQVLGGYGYCQEYPIEQYLRDEKIASIYEGTNGIQALDLLSRKLTMKNGALFASYMEKVGAFLVAQKDHPSLGELVGALDEARKTLVDVTKFLGMKAKEKALDYAFLQASPYLVLFGHTAIFHLLLEQAVIADKRLAELAKAKGLAGAEAIRAAAEGDEEIKFYAGKIASAKFFAANVLPEMGGLAKAIKSGDRTALDVAF
jgi:alkylation response protein AidB-like acyl-CoA dehydrogenase